jgi:hypothetical protein
MKITMVMNAKKIIDATVFFMAVLMKYNKLARRSMTVAADTQKIDAFLKLRGVNFQVVQIFTEY